jgi:hypothetical protein
MISTEDKVRLLKYIDDPPASLPAWVVIVLKRFVEESDETDKRLIELDEELAKTVIEYEEQISFLRVLLSYSGWEQNEEGEWVRKVFKDEAVRVGATGKYPR